MAWTTYQIALAIVMVITGSLNTLSTKWADRQLAVGSDGKERKFDHPFLQAVGMFIGEFTCLIAYFVIKMCCRQQQVVDGEQPRSFNPLIFLPAALLDMCGTSIMYIGLNLTYASSFQMLRGAVIIFTALLSVAFLGRVIKKHMWVGMFTVLLGLLLVGLADIVFGSHDDTTTNTNGIIAGDLLIIMAQVIVSVQMVYEERVIGRYNVQPLAAVGSEAFIGGKLRMSIHAIFHVFNMAPFFHKLPHMKGFYTQRGLEPTAVKGLFGALVLGILLIPFYYIHAGSFSNTAGNRLENAEDAFVQMGNNWKIILATVGNIMSIAFFNFAGISVTRELSATTRMVLDSVRTLVIWAVTLLLSWQDFQYLQVVGFVLLVIGMALYNDIIIMPWWRRRKERREMREIERHDGDDDERRRLLENDGAGHVVN